MTSYREALQTARQAFQTKGLPSAALDARQLLLAAADMDAASLITKDQLPIPQSEHATYQEFCARRLKGEPVARIIGHKEFYGYAFSLNAHTLVPRPETEMLVDLALEKSPPNGKILDLGTGSGAILLSILAERADLSGVGVDLSEEALIAANQNANALGVDARVEFIQSDWFSALEGQKFDLIAANPPYIGDDERNEMNDEALLFDPHLALFADDQGLAAYRTICSAAHDHLHRNGWLMFEIGHRQGNDVCQLCSANGFDGAQILKDLSGLDRVVFVQRK
jgi:release factor glutamine methyltransferase